MCQVECTGTSCPMTSVAADAGLRLHSGTAIEWDKDRKMERDSKGFGSRTTLSKNSWIDFDSKFGDDIAKTDYEIMREYCGALARR